MSGKSEAIAIVGVGCRFPGNADTPSKLWDLLESPHDVLRPHDERFNPDGWYHESGKYHGHSNVKKAYQLAGDAVHRRFDANFFGINAVEANTMDPQMRLLLETVYESLEAAGIPIDKLRGSDTAVYSGLMTNNYKHLLERDMDSIGTYYISGTAQAMMSNRISYFFDFHGPSMTIDTACSSSLVAVHQAVQQLRSGQSRVAIACGSNLLLDTPDYVGMSKLEMLSSDSRSRMWDTEAKGYARGEGVGAVVLKTLSAALADGDHIECLIRETAINQDGRTPGITMPNAAAQAQLIRDCYTRAGLNAADPAHHPQYFEAHGTGTQAGDPVEAEAIDTAFFPGQRVASQGGSGSEKLFVGSIKTVIGHTEGTAGLAGIMKASLALQNSVILPNLLFNRLNPKIEPFYRNLCVPTSTRPWPSVPEGCPRRASVNSFGFGGANAHAILESYAPEKRLAAYKDHLPVIPFVFSAASQTSLASYLRSVCDFVKANESVVNLSDLAFTLHARRSRLSYCTAVTATTVEDLVQNIEERLDAAKKQPEQAIGVKSSIQNSEGRKPKILGIFTGQGAQSARMGAALLENSEAARNIIEKLEKRLDRLPHMQRPSWSLKQELLRNDPERISQATLAQPLCTAVQILQVDLLRAAGIEFSAVCGHSSGEIGAAYCAGLISAEDAICIAYYRGFHTALARGPKGQQGAMLAVGTSFEDAQDVCNEAQFQGRVSVAAINSPVSVTLSGDEDAIHEIQTIFEDERKSARLLKVDKAYHSHHMLACSDAYLKSSRGLRIRVSDTTTVPWFSSVNGGKPIGAEETSELEAAYWNDNMISPVKFMQAVEGAWKNNGPFDLAIELGPHPALKGPALQTIQELCTKTIPYTGIFARGKNAIATFSDALGYIWTHLNVGDFAGYQKFVTGAENLSLVKGLPPYAWDHGKEYWHESRYTRAIRNRSGPVNELLGHLAPDATQQDLRWRNILCPKELPWLSGHALQNQIVFPAAGYVVSALEAAVAMCQGRHVVPSVIELLNLDIGKALAFDSEETRMEIICSLTNIVQPRDDQIIEAVFRVNATDTMSGDLLNLLATGQVRVTLGDDTSQSQLSSRGPREPNLIRIDSDEFYKSLLDLEYQYTGPFHALTSLERKYGYSTGFITNEPTELMIHPAVLDAAIQSLLLCHSAPGSGGLWSLHVPKTISTVRVNPRLCELARSKNAPLPFDAQQSTGMLIGDVDVFSHDSECAMLQIEGLECVPFSQANEKEDKELFATTVWDVITPNARVVAYDGEPTEDRLQLASLLERASIFYLHQLDVAFPSHHPARHEGPYPSLFKFATHITSLSRENKLPFWSPDWAKDVPDTLAAACEPYAHVIDMKLLKEIGENLIDIVRGNKQPIEVGMKDSMLSEFYSDGMGMQENTAYLARLVKQIVHRFPHMNILEVGAGTGGVTKRIFQETGHRFASYHFTDISSGFFETARQVPQFEPSLNKMHFEVLDISKDPCQQGFTEHTYDLIIASAVIHATPLLQETMQNLRKLLKPGGFLVVLEFHAMDNIARAGSIFGAFPGWWLGADDGRVLSPCINPPDWDSLLRGTGFSGCDTVTPTRNIAAMPAFVFVSQAVDERVEFLRDPLSSPMALFEKDEQGGIQKQLILLGGSSLRTSRLVGQLKTILQHQWGRNIRNVRSLAELSSSDLSSSTTVLSLTEMDAPVFKNLDNQSWQALQSMLHEAATILWISKGRRAEEPYANMMVGLLRGSKMELPTLNIQFFDAEEEYPEARTIATALLQLSGTVLYHHRDGQDSLLSTVEPEIVRERGGQLLIPRVMPSRERNHRYNSLRRPISRTLIDENEQNISIDSSSPPGLQGVPVLEDSEASCRIRVTHSLRSKIRISGFGHLYLVMGRDCNSHNQVVALSNENALFSSAVDDLRFELGVPDGSEAEFIYTLACSMLANVTLEGLAEGDKVLIHEPDSIFAACLEEQSKRCGVTVNFTTTSEPPAHSSWLKIHTRAPDRTIRSLGIADTALFIDFSRDETPGAIGDRIRSRIPFDCQVHTLDTLFATQTTCSPRKSQLHSVRERLETCISSALSQLKDLETVDIPKVSLAALAPSAEENSSPVIPPQTVVMWPSSVTGLSIPVRPVESQIKFSDSKTYWLAGLSGGLGLLLCEWMEQHGAKYIVISSRTPKIAEAWQENMRTKGTFIKVLACDVTNKKDVLSTYEAIASSMPPIGGVCQGAMVLEDTPFRDMSLEALQKVTAPKVQGSLHLNDLFQHQNLDFFIFFSSVGSVNGNLGQSNYAAANLFMTALAENRRRRGLAASVMHIGPIQGVGYITQQGIKSQSIERISMPISEQDFLHHFAEAVLTGRPNSLSALEITAGLRRIDNSTMNQDVSPFMSHYIQDREVAQDDSSADQSKAPIKTQLAEARGREQVSRIIKDALLPKLSVLFHSDLGELQRADLATLRLDEMGIDSLMAVDIRGWFVKTLEVNIPVLKILSGVPVSELIAVAVENIPASLVPHVGEEALDLPVEKRLPSEKTKQDSVSPQKNKMNQDPRPQTDFQPQQQELSMPEANTSTSSSSKGDVTPESDLELVDAAEMETLGSSFTSVTSATDHQDRKEAMVGGPFTLVTAATDRRDTKGETPLLDKSVRISHSQGLFWFATAFSEDPTCLNITARFRLKGKLRISDLQKAVSALGQQHESLRTCILEKDSQVMQGIMKSTPLNLEVYQIHDNSEVVRHFEEVHHHVYDLRRGHMVRLVLLSTSPNEHHLLAGVHHMAMDATSFQFLMKDLLQHYTRIGNPNIYPELRAPQYSDFSEKQHIEFESGELKDELSFWRRELSPIPPELPILRMSTMASRPSLKVFGNEQAEVRIDPKTKALIQALCRRSRVTPFHFYLAVLRVLLWRYSGAEDFAIGIADANRTDEGMMGALGNFVNLLPLVFHTHGSVNFDTLLHETRSKTHSALGNSRLPFQLILNELAVPRSAVAPPIFQAFVDYHMGQQEKTTWGDCELELQTFRLSKQTYDVTLDIIDDCEDGGCLLTFIVRDGLYSREDAEQLAQSYAHLAKEFVSQPRIALSEPDLFSKSKIEEALNLGRGPIHQSRQWGNTVIHRIEDLAKRHAKRIAVITDDNKPVTYGELVLDGANAIAAELVAMGVSAGSRVAVLQESTAHWVSSVLAIMRIGATYLPLDPSLPWTRLAIIVNDCEASVVLVDENTRRHAGELQRPEMKAIDVSKINMSECKSQVPISCRPEDVCTILYTSGSSGIPKGIELPHQGIRAWLEPCAMLYGMSFGKEVLLQQSSQGFDMSLMQIFTALCFGGSVYLLPRSLRGDARAISEAITRHGITHTYGTPSEYFSWLSFGEKEKLQKSNWKTALVGGEQLQRSLLQAFAALGKSDLHFHHMYGTTESTFCATVMELPYDELADMAVSNYAAGVALPNYSVYVLDELKKPLPAGLQGEIYIGGAGVARGYLNRPDLTAEKFVPDVFATAEEVARGWTMVQRTGDLGRWSQVDKGAILIEGRISGDTMVKLRGLRVDLREVENALLHAAGGALSEVVVSVRRSSPETPEFLVAHVVFDQAYSREKVMREECLRQVRALLELPLYMRPAFIVPLERMPLMPSGKTDRRAVGALSLPEDETMTTSEDVMWTPVEERLKLVWEEVLNNLTSVKRITPQTDFFHVGGTSLLILNLRDKIRAEFKVELSVVDLFEASILQQMAQKIEGAFEEIEEINWDEEIALTPSILELAKGPLRPVPYSDEKVVILTGASGYLGKGIVDALIADPTVKEIHCVAVRNASSRTELSDLEKVTAYEGDLTHPLIGLPQSIIDDLFGRAHVIIHNGADTSHLKTYQSLKQCNFLTTQNFIEWSMPRMVPMHYVSTAGIGYFAHDGEALGEFSLSARPPPVDGSMGYDASKWASENFLEQLTKRNPDWPICVHRPTLISRDDVPELDIAHNLMLYSRKLGAVPTARVQGVMNVVTLDTVVNGILDCALAYYHPPPAGTKVHFVNHVGNLDLPFGNMRKWALERTSTGDVDFANVDLREIPMNEWAEKATNLGMHVTVSAFLTSFGGLESARFPKIVKDSTDLV